MEVPFIKEVDISLQIKPFLPSSYLQIRTWNTVEAFLFAATEIEITETGRKYAERLSAGGGLELTLYIATEEQASKTQFYPSNLQADALSSSSVFAPLGVD